MKPRPTSVTVISWILIALGALALIASQLMLRNPQVQAAMAQGPLPVPVQMSMVYGGTAVSLVSGIAMLFGQNWARLLYTVWGVVAAVVNLATSPAKLTLLPSLVIFAVIVFFLFRPKANAYFAGGRGGNPGGEAGGGVAGR